MKNRQLTFNYFEGPKMKIMQLNEKHGNRFVKADDINEAALRVITDRLNEGYWYDNWDDGDPNHQWEDRAEEIVCANDAKAAYKFLSERRSQEYEGFEINEVE
jgi:hypothetical protein